MNRSRAAKPIIPLIIALAVLAASCGGAQPYLNREYRFPPASASVLALFPTEYHSKPVNDALEAAFSTAPMKQVLPPGELAKRLKLTSYYHGRIKAGDRTDSLQVLLDEKHYTYLVTTLSPATLLLVPTEMKFTTTSRYSYVDYAFKLYDLRSGVLLYMNNYSVRSDDRGPKAEAQLRTDAAKQIASEVINLFAGR